MGDDDEPVDLKQFKRSRRKRVKAAHNEAREQLAEAIWCDLEALWVKHAELRQKAPPMSDGKRLSGEPEFVFAALLDGLLNVAEDLEIDNADMLKTLCRAVARVVLDEE
jgi:hypothetical protein